MERLQENIIKTSRQEPGRIYPPVGDIDNRHGGSEKEAMQAGSRIHRKIQRMMGGDTGQRSRSKRRSTGRKKW